MHTPVDARIHDGQAFHRARGQAGAHHAPHGARASHGGTDHGWRRWVSIVLTTLRRAASSVHSRSILRTALITVE